MTIVYGPDGAPIDVYSCTIEEHAIAAASRNRPVTNPPIRRRRTDTPADNGPSLVEGFVNQYLRETT